MFRFGECKISCSIFFVVPCFLFFTFNPISALEQTYIKKMLAYPYVHGEILVRFAPKESGSQRNVWEKSQILSTLGSAKIEESYKIVPGLSLVKLPEDQTVENALSIYNKTEGILNAKPDYINRN